MQAKDMMEEAAAKMIEAQMLDKQRKKNPVHNKRLTAYEAYKLERIDQLKTEDPEIKIQKLTKIIYDEWQRVDVDFQ
jgi:hypothetical protein